MGEKLSVNPWLQMWTKPRETIRAIVQYNPKYLFGLLAGIYGFPLLLQFAQNLSLGETTSFTAIFLVSLVFSVFVGMLGITIISGLVYWTGQWIGGKSSYQNIRAAIAWANVPNIVNIAVWMVLSIVFGGQLFTRAFAEATFVGYQLTLVFLAFLVQAVIAVWGFVIALKALGEVQGFSAWKALLNVLIPFFMLVIGFWFVMWICYMIFGMPH
jgi:hypothetical protein